MDTQEIRDTLKYANDYLNRLVNLNVDLDYAVKQITLTAQETEESIASVFNSILSTITEALNKRKEHLLKRTKKIESSGLRPLVESRQLVLKTIESTTNLISLGCSLLNVENGCNLEVQKDEFASKSSLLGNLPEVPSLKEVPYISFQHELVSEKQLKEICDSFGSVVHIAPVQIASISERPGALLVEWSAAGDDDRLCDIQEYRLQRAFGNINTDKELHKNFYTCYTGPETQLLIKDALWNQDYTFRVCCKFEGEAQWSPWSLLQVSSTTIRPYCWKKIDGQKKRR